MDPVGAPALGGPQVVVEVMVQLVVGAAGGTYGYAGGSGGSSSYQWWRRRWSRCCWTTRKWRFFSQSNGGNGVIVNILPAANMGTGSGTDKCRRSFF